MTILRSLHWPLVLGLGALALVRPLVSTVLHQLRVSDPPAVPVLITVAVSAVWVAVVGLSRVARPVLTLLFVGLTYAVLSILLSGVLSPVLTGTLQGPLAQPLAIVPVLVTNALWGLVCGALALLLQRARGEHAAAGSTGP